MIILHACCAYAIEGGMGALSLRVDELRHRPSGRLRSVPQGHPPTSATGSLTPALYSGQQ